MREQENVKEDKERNINGHKQERVKKILFSI